MSSRSSIRAVHKASRGEEMVAALRRGTDNHRLCTWPGREGFDFVLVPLHCGEFQEAYAAAEKRFADLSITITLLNHDDFTSEVNTQVLAIAIRDVNDTNRKVRLFPNGAALRSVITQDERSLITDEYIDLEDAANPDLDALDPEVRENIELAIKKKAQATLRSFGSNTLSCFLAGTADPPSS